MIELSHFKEFFGCKDIRKHMKIHGHKIDFVGPFPPSEGEEYILVAVDYVSKWVLRFVRDASFPNTVVRGP